jgi:hypothetical protein
MACFDLTACLVIMDSVPKKLSTDLFLTRFGHALGCDLDRGHSSLG